MMKNTIFLFLLTLVLFSCNSNESGESINNIAEEKYTTKTHNIDSSQQEETYQLHPEIKDSVSQPLEVSNQDSSYQKKSITNINFSQLDPKKFMDLNANYQNQHLINPCEMDKKENYFALKIGSETKIFSTKLPANAKDGPYHVCQGYIKPLDSYQIVSCDNEWCITFLLNASTGKRSNFDVEFLEPSLPIFSSNLEMFLIYTTGSFDGGYGTELLLFRRNSISKQFNCDEYEYFITEKWEVKELIWIDEQTIGVETKENQFLKGHIKK